MRVPVRVIDDDCVGSGQVDPQATGSRGEEEDKLRGTRSWEERGGGGGRREVGRRRRGEGGGGRREEGGGGKEEEGGGRREGGGGGKEEEGGGGGGGKEEGEGRREGMEGWKKGERENREEGSGGEEERGGMEGCTYNTSVTPHTQVLEDDGLTIEPVDGLLPLRTGHAAVDTLKSVAKVIQEVLKNV